MSERTDGYWVEEEGNFGDRRKRWVSGPRILACAHVSPTQGADARPVAMTNGSFHCPACGEAMKGPLACGHCLWQKPEAVDAEIGADGIATRDAAPSDALAQALAEIERLNAIINTPHADDFMRSVSIEAEHQRQRWGAEGDAGKTPADWFWLVGYLAGKALHSHAGGNVEKGEHHIITTAAACANWHRALFGKTDMRPGHEEGTGLIAASAPREKT